MTPLLNIIRSREHPVKHTTLSIKKPIENKNKVLAINGEEGLPALLQPIPSRESPPNQIPSPQFFPLSVAPLLLILTAFPYRNLLQL
ncbi:hypothetical protein M9H77_06397 [Catharanthus roseus]|uniref:Uncharacterized protein n=1 Tax=Catharanthus roseus TaxID=4058 RepID=A0ACC0BS96_CATRO|nr:hypothetical protein M9H77_06397 [Catharanthus roseus]